MMPIITEIVDPFLSQRFITTIVAWLIVGCLFTGFVFSEIAHWRQATLFLLFIPYAVLLIAFLLLFQDTPQSLLKTKTA